MCRLLNSRPLSFFAVLIFFGFSASCFAPEIDLECEDRCNNPQRNFCDVKEQCNARGEIIGYEYTCVPYPNPDETECDVFPDEVCILGENRLAVVLDECD